MHDTPVFNHKLCNRMGMLKQTGTVKRLKGNIPDKEFIQILE
jgi:hypothetical protein